MTGLLGTNCALKVMATSSLTEVVRLFLNVTLVVSVSSQLATSSDFFIQLNSNIETAKIETNVVKCFMLIFFSPRRTGEAEVSQRFDFAVSALSHYLIISLPHPLNIHTSTHSHFHTASFHCLIA